MKTVSIGVEGFDVPVTDSPQWFDHLIEKYAVLDEEVTLPVTHYYSNRSVAVMHRKTWECKDSDSFEQFISDLVAAGWSDPTAEGYPYETRLYRHPDHWGHEIMIIQGRGVYFITNRYYVLSEV